jgi:hypothetical protein
MRLLVIVARWETILLIAGFGVVTLWRLFQSVSFAGLLRSADGTMSPGRAQLLVLTIFTALQYLLTTMHDPTSLPHIPSGVVIALGGSQAIYLGTKAWSIFGSK